MMLALLLPTPAALGQAVLPSATRGPEDVESPARPARATGFPAVARSEVRPPGSGARAAGTAVDAETGAASGDARLAAEGGRDVNFFTGFHVRRSEMADPQEGGQFSIANGSTLGDDGAGSWSADVYMLFDPQERGWQVFDSPEMGAYAFFEAHVAAAKDDAEDNVRLGAAVFWANDVTGRDYRIGRHPITDVITDLSLRYEGDRDADTAQLVLDLAFTANAPSLGVGNNVPDRRGALHFHWRPVVGIEGGPELAERDNDTDADAAPLRVYADLKAHVNFDFLRQRLDLAGRPFLFAQNRFAWLPTVGGGGGLGRNLVLFGFEVPIHENVGFQIAWTYGWDAPEYDKVRTFEGGLTVKF